MTNLRYIIIVAFLFFIANSVNLYGQGVSPNLKARTDATKHKAPTGRDFEQAEKAAERFISVFRRNLDFGDAFKAFFVSDSINRMRKANFFSSMNFDHILVSTSDNASLERAYIALMNFYYLKAVYDLNYPIDMNNSEDSLPSEIRTAVEKSRYLEELLAGVSDGGQAVRTRKEMEQFTQEYERVAGLYKKYLPANPFDTETYLKNISEEEDSVRLRNGYPEYDVGPAVKVYMLKRDLFYFFFIKADNEMRILTLGLGN